MVAAARRLPAPRRTQRMKAATNSIPTDLMRALALLVTLLAGACASSTSPVIGGADYAPTYDFSEFYAATNGKTFRVIIEGNPFPALTEQESARRLLPVMQANRPR